MANTDPFAFLENVLTSDTLREMRKVDNHNAQILANSMTANARAGYGFGRAIFAGLGHFFGPQKRQREEAKAGDRALAASAQEMDAMDTSQFEGPEGGMKRNLAKLQSLQSQLQSQGLQEDAMRAGIASNQLQQQIAEAADARKERQATTQGRELQNDIYQAQLRQKNRTNILDRQTYYIDAEDKKFVGSLDMDAPGFDARQQLLLNKAKEDGRTIIPYSREEAVKYLGDQLKQHDQALFTSHDFVKQRNNITSSTQGLRMANDFFELMNTTESNPLSDVSSANRFFNRLFNDYDAFRGYLADSKLLQSHDWGASEAQVNSEYRAWAQDRGVENQLSKTYMIDLAYLHALRFNQRVTDADFDWARAASGGDSGDPRLAVTALQALFGQDIENTGENFSALMDSGALTGGQKSVFSRDYANWQQQASKFHTLANKARNRWTVQAPAETPAPAADQGVSHGNFRFN